MNPQTPEAVLEAAAAAASEAELRSLWQVWRRLTLARLLPKPRKAPAPPWHEVESLPREEA